VSEIKKKGTLNPNCVTLCIMLSFTRLVYFNSSVNSYKFVFIFKSDKNWVTVYSREQSIQKNVVLKFLHIL
jgi:hypothetical protein